jgi:hypothetical protein
VTELGGNCRPGCQCPATADHGRPAGPPEAANQEEQREIKRLRQELRGKDKALAGAAALLYESPCRFPVRARTAFALSGLSSCRLGGRHLGWPPGWELLFFKLVAVVKWVNSLAPMANIVVVEFLSGTIPNPNIISDGLELLTALNTKLYWPELAALPLILKLEAFCSGPPLAGLPST